jgi:hypothetical protein
MIRPCNPAANDRTRAAEINRQDPDTGRDGHAA